MRRAFARVSAGYFELRHSAAIARGALQSPEGRWALISTSLTATIAGTIAWLALAAAPPSSARAYEPRREQAALPYELLVRLSNKRPIPGIASEDAGKMVVARNQAQGVAQSADDEALDNVLATEQLGLATPDMPNVEKRTLTVDPGDTLAGVLADAGVEPNEAQLAVNAVDSVWRLRNLRAGQSLSATFGVAVSAPDATEDATTLVKLLGLSFSPSVEHQIVVKRNADGTFAAQDIETKLENQYRHATATIDSSLYLAAMQAGIPADVVVEMIRMFSYDVDFQRDVHPGDSFEILYRGYFTPEGQAVAKNGAILSASMTLGRKVRKLYRFETDEGGVEYFDEKGRSAKNMLMKTPIDGARITSRYGMRKHPILGYSRMHRGIDFGAPKGTPVMAAGSGKVVESGWRAGYGKFIRVRHGSGYETAYGHLSRITVNRGGHVRQGQTIGSVGMTGTATGPHLHYEIRVNSAQVNPLRVKVAAGRQLKGKELKTFLLARAETDRMEASIPVQKAVADATGDLRTIEQ
ncbi:MAG: M23 family metallopeptidase [Alphaproteobacteria bacterium]